MSDEQTPRPSGPSGPSDPAASGPSTAGPGPSPDRRGFLRHLTGQAVNVAGTIAGASGIMMRSASAAADAVAAEFGLGESGVGPGAGAKAGPDEGAEAGPGDPGHATIPAAIPEAPAAPAAIASAAPPTSPPLRRLTDRESELLASTSAVVAVNSQAGSPQMTRAPFHWDGEVARLSGHLFGARTSSIERDGRISVFIEDALGWLTLTGEATVVAGPAARLEAQPLLAHLYRDERADDVWARLEAEAMQAVIVLRPTRVVSGAR